MSRVRQKFVRNATVLIIFIVMTVSAQINPFKIVQDDELEKEAAKKFTSAQRYYRDGNYWKSSRELISLIDEYPEFSQTAQATFTLGNCLYELDMPAGAFKLYERLVKKYISSNYIPDALLGLQRIEYDRDDYSASLQFYETLVRGNPSSTTTDLANYYAGMAYYKLADYPKAVDILSQAGAKSPYYDYILYTLAVSLLRMQNVNPAIEVFQQLFDLSTTTSERRHVIDEGHLTLGYLYYELGYYDEAVEQFGAVTPNSANHIQALLAIGWAASQKEEWQQAIAPLTELYTRYETNDATQEGLFLLGRTYVKLNRYDDAITVYDRLIGAFPDEGEVTTSIETINANIELERKRVEKRQQELLILEGNLVDDLSDKSRSTRSFSQDQTILLRDIQKERQELATHMDQLDKLAVTMALREERRNWRAYAEYGKSRATFLRRQQERHQKKQNSQ